MRLALLAGLLLLAPPALSQEPLLHPRCADAQEPVLVAQWDAALENLAFDGAGSVYVSDLGRDRLLRVTPDGAVHVVADVPGMHGTTFGPDGKLYVGAAGEDGAQVWRVDSFAPFTHEVVMDGLLAANGMAFDTDGDLFVSSPLSASGPYLVRGPAGDLAAWEAWGDEYGTNGLWPDPADGSLLSVVTADQSSRVLRLSTTDPDDVQVVADLTFGAGTLQPGVHEPRGEPFLAPKGLDDLTLAPDGMIYAAAHVTGELLRVDPDTGAACAYAAGFEEPASVRVAHGFGAWDGHLVVVDMGGQVVSGFTIGGAGAVWAVPLGPAQAGAANPLC